MSPQQKKTTLYAGLALLGIIILALLLRSRGETPAQVIETGGGELPVTPYSVQMDLPAPSAGGTYNIYGGDGGNFIWGGSNITPPNSYLPPRTGNPVPIFEAGNGNPRIPSIQPGGCCNDCSGGLGPTYMNPVSYSSAPSLPASIALNTGPMTSAGR